MTLKSLDQAVEKHETRYGYCPDVIIVPDEDYAKLCQEAREMGTTTRDDRIVPFLKLKLRDTPIVKKSRVSFSILDLTEEEGD